MATAQATLTQIGMSPLAVSEPCATSARKMTPIVFCASPVPCASETRDAEPIWPQRKCFSRACSGALSVMRYDQPGAGGGDDQRDERREHRRDDDAGEHQRPVHPAGEAQPGHGGADQAAEQGVRGTGRQAQQPGGQVPDDAADQPGEHDGDQQVVAAGGVEERQRRTVLVLDLDHLGDGLGHLDGQERADQVQHAGHGHRDLRLQRAGRDGRRHRVARVVESVGEVEGERGRDRPAPG